MLPLALGGAAIAAAGGAVWWAHMNHEHGRGAVGGPGGKAGKGMRERGGCGGEGEGGWPGADAEHKANVQSPGSGRRRGGSWVITRPRKEETP